MDWPRLELPIHLQVHFVLVHPHYPENVGAAARAMKTMGFLQLGLVKPGRLAVPEHEMAHKMAVRSWDVLEGAQRFATVEDALVGADLVVATTARRGTSGATPPRQLAPELLVAAHEGQRIVLLFGNEKTGLSEAHSNLAHRFLRIPMAADQPSVNLAQSVQIVAYELFAAALEQRNVAASAVH